MVKKIGLVMGLVTISLGQVWADGGATAVQGTMRTVQPALITAQGSAVKYLVNHLHTEKSCTDAGGILWPVPNDPQGRNFCKFLGKSTCAITPNFGSPWRAYNHWTTTTAVTVNGSVANSCTYNPPGGGSPIVGPGVIPGVPAGHHNWNDINPNTENGSYINVAPAGGCGGSGNMTSC